MPQPPLLPLETLARVLRLARIDGMGVVVFAGLYALLAATAGDTMGAVIGLLGAGAGAVELHGAGLLRHGERRGVSWLVASQPFLLGVIFAYCFYRWTHFVVPPLPEELRPMITLSAQQWGMSLEEYYQFVNRLTSLLVAIVSTFYQGGMTIYYLRRRHAVARALQGE